MDSSALHFQGNYHWVLTINISRSVSVMNCHKYDDLSLSPIATQHSIKSALRRTTVKHATKRALRLLPLKNFRVKDDNKRLMDRASLPWSSNCRWGLGMASALFYPALSCPTRGWGEILRQAPVNSSCRKGQVTIFHRFRSRQASSPQTISGNNSAQILSSVASLPWSQEWIDISRDQRA